MDTAKRVEQRVRRSQALLERMTRHKERVLEALGPAEGGKVVEELDTLADQAASVRRGDELLALTGRVFQLVKTRPALEEEFGHRSWRSANWGDINNILSEIEASEYAHQIANSVERLGQAVSHQLEKLPNQQGRDDRR